MAHTPHDLVDEFPEHAAKIHQLKLEDGHFARLFNDYFEINEAIHHAETNIEPTDDLHLTEMRKKRMALKDEIYGILTGS